MEWWKDFLLWFGAVLVVLKVVLEFLRHQEIGHLGDKAVFITGCDSGFGRQIALQLDKKGCKVFAGCFTKEGEVSLQREASSDLHVVSLDVTKSESIMSAVATIKQSLKPKQGLWAVVNNAAIPASQGPTDWLSRDSYQRVLEVNVLGLLEVTNTCLPLVKAARGRVVLMSSFLGFLPLPRYAAYSMSKAAVEAFGDALRRELHIWGVSVHIIRPGGFRTGIENKLHKCTIQQFHRLPPEMQHQYGAQYLHKMTDQKYFEWFPSDLSPVVNAVTNAVTSLFPHTRYTIGWDANMFYLLAFLPDWMVDRILQPLVTNNLPAILQR